MNVYVSNNFTLSEALKFIPTPPEIVDRVDSLMDELSRTKKELTSLKRDLDIAEEDIYFRDVFIQGILEELDICTTYKDLAKAIRIRFEESGIEY